jgi:hypothetical protein
MNFKILSLAIILSSASVSFAQDKHLDYVVRKGNDTTLAIDVSYSRKIYYVKTINYYDANGKYIRIEGIDKCQRIKSFRSNGHIFDLVPKKPKKADGDLIYLWRRVDGKIKVYEYYKDTRRGDLGSTFYFHTVKLGNNKYYKINQKNINAYIKPYLLKCKKFEAAFKGEFTFLSNDFDEMIKLYNALCEE